MKTWQKALIFVIALIVVVVAYNVLVEIQFIDWGR